MDDILCFYVKNDKWDYEKFVSDLCKSEVYVPPLKLEDGKPGTFLETRFQITESGIDHWLKNENENGINIWRYNHFHSHGSYIQKRATLTACLRKVQFMASNRQALIQSAKNKINEFKNLGYPASTLKGVCTFLAATTGNDAWVTVRNLL